MKMWAFLTTAAGLAFATAAPSLAAINAPVPTANYITVDGVDWAWASPCSPAGCSSASEALDLSYQATQGWRVPTLAEFLARPEASAFGTASSFKCATAWFSGTYNHCDYADVASGYLFDFGYGVTSNGSYSVAETWLVRSVSGAVPEPATWAMMIGGFALAGAAMRRRATKVSFA